MWYTFGTESEGKTMPKMYQFSEKEVAELEAAKKKNKNKKVDKRLEALLLRSQKASRKVVSEKTGFSKQYITDLTSQYHNKGLAAVSENHYRGNHRNMSFAEEEKLLQTFEKAAESGQIVGVDDIRRAYEEKLGRSVEKSHGHIYQMLKRHKFRKVMPRSRHPKKASPEVIETSKKLTLESKN
jgi:transposase